MIQAQYQLLTTSPVGEQTRIEAVTSPMAQHRLQLLGIDARAILRVEHRGDYGDLIVAVGTRRVHLPEHLARRIRVCQTDAEPETNAQLPIAQRPRRRHTGRRRASH